MLSTQTGNLPGTGQISAGTDRSSFPDDLAGLPGRLLADGAASQAFIAAQGAQVLSWRDRSGRERLYLSPQTGGYRRGDPADNLHQPIRGGIPVSFPQFSGRGPLLKHGFARSLLWQLAAPQPGRSPADAPIATLSLREDAQTRAIWSRSFQADLSVAIEPDQLRVALAITNTGHDAWSFTAALHTYLKVDDIHQTALAGLHNTTYQDATAGNTETLQHDPEVRISGEVDRVYLTPPNHLVLLENDVPVLAIEQQGFADTVVWNPGPANARALKDFPDADWRRMLCVEAACAAHPVVLTPGETWRGWQSLTAITAAS